MPLPVLIILTGIGILFLCIKRKKAGKFLLVASLFWFLVISTNYVPAFIIQHIESNYLQFSDERIENLPNSFNIIVLGAGHSDDKSLSPNNQLSQEVLGRLVEAILIYKKASGIRHQASGNILLSSESVQRKPETGSLKPEAKIIMSGYKGRSEISQAEVLYRAGLMLGIDSAAMDISDRPSNTIEEAEEYVRKFGTVKPLVVVTSASHMKRAASIFTDKGINVIPAPCNFIIKHGSSKPRGRWIPSGGNIRMMEVAIHEYAGMMWYRLWRQATGVRRQATHLR